MQHMPDTIFIKAASVTLLHHDSYLEHLKLGTQTGHKSLQHTAVMDTVIVKAEEDIAKTEVDLEGAAVVTTSLNLTAPIGHTTRMEPNPDLSRI